MEGQAEARGYLVVEMPYVGDLSDETPPRYPLAYLYDAGGHLLEQLPDGTENPIALPPGQYIVLVGDQDPMGEFHQVEVRIADGRTTAVSLRDIQDAPEFWAAARLLSK